jgi:hypothetical protein
MLGLLPVTRVAIGVQPTSCRTVSVFQNSLCFTGSLAEMGAGFSASSVCASHPINEQSGSRKGVANIKPELD